jgi:hypothetical protein
VTDKSADKPDSVPGDKPVAATPPVRPSVKEDTPHDSKADPATAPEDPYGEARLLRAQAAAIEAAAPPSDEWIKLKVGPPHTSFIYGGVEVGEEWTGVHRSLAPGVLNAAAEAGVTVTQEGAE